MAPVTRGQLYFLAAALAGSSVLCLILAASMGRDVRSHVGEQYQAYGDNRYTCTGTPAQAANELAQYQEPEARASDRGSEYLRYEDDVAIVGPDGGRPCTVRMESLDEGYSHGAFIFLGPGFTPGSPAGGSGGSPGGPDGTK